MEFESRQLPKKSMDKIKKAMTDYAKTVYGNKYGTKMKDHQIYIFQKVKEKLNMMLILKVDYFQYQMQN